MYNNVNRSPKIILQIIKPLILYRFTGNYKPSPTTLSINRIALGCLSTRLFTPCSSHQLRGDKPSHLVIFTRRFWTYLHLTTTWMFLPFSSRFVPLGFCEAMAAEIVSSAKIAVK